MKILHKLAVIIIVVAIITSVPCVSASATGSIAYGAATVDTTNLNLRAGPGMTYTVMATLTEGDIVVILERTDSEWYYINFHGVTGYVNTAYLRDVLTAENFSAIGRITGDQVNIRIRPSTTSDYLATYREDTVMTVIGINDGWYKVSHEGHVGYVRSDYMTIINGTRASSSTTSSSGASGTSYTAPPANLPLGQQIVHYALGFLGSSYVWGGTSPSGFDCSGFVTYVYRYFDVAVSRTAQNQYTNNGVTVAKQDLSPGDLVFFSSNGGGSVTHVGIYIGDDEFVHASSYSTGVIVSRLDSAYYVSVWHGAKRLI